MSSIVISPSNLFTGHFVESALQINLEVFFSTLVFCCVWFWSVLSHLFSFHSFIFDFIFVWLNANYNHSIIGNTQKYNLWGNAFENGLFLLRAA